MTAALLLKIQEEMKNCMRNKEATRLLTIRMLLAAIKQKEIDERITLDDNQIVAIIDKMIRQRNDSISQYQAANRQDLVTKEEQEITILMDFMPSSLAEDEIQKIIADAIKSTGASSIKEMAKVMNIIKAQAQGRADMSKISALVKKMLEN